MLKRTFWALAAVALVSAAVYESVTRGWLIGGIVIVFALLPDIALIGAFDVGRRGMLRPERVMFYNVMHLARFPVLLAATGALIQPPSPGGVGFGPIMLAAGLAWLAHIAVDRAFGYGLRDAEGAIRTVAGQSAPGVCQA